MRLSKAIYVVIVILFVAIACCSIGLRLAFVYLDAIKPTIIRQLESATQSQITVAQLSGKLTHISPTFKIKNLHILTKDADYLINNIAFSVNILASLRHFRPQLNSLTIDGVVAHINTLHSASSGSLNDTRSTLENVFFRQIRYYSAKNITITLNSPSNESVILTIPHIDGDNRYKRHQIQAFVSAQTKQQQLGSLQLLIDLKDKFYRIDQGMIYIKGDNLDLHSWLMPSVWTKSGLEKITLGGESWVAVKKGMIDTITTRINKGDVVWKSMHGIKHTIKTQSCLFSIKNNAILKGWLLNIPQLNLQTDNMIWPNSNVHLLWRSKSAHAINFHQGEIRLRLRKLSLEQLYPVFYSLSQLNPDLLGQIKIAHPTGMIEHIFLDIPLEKPKASKVDVRWTNVHWSSVDKLPGIEQFSGHLIGSYEKGGVYLSLGKGKLTYLSMFKQPIPITSVSGQLNWHYSDQELALTGNNWQFMTPDLQMKGNFRYQQPKGGSPYLAILGATRLHDVKQAWRYYPGPLMGEDIANYLTNSLHGGSVDEATMIFAGNPQQFPFRQHQGLFQFHIPLKKAIFKFDKAWPALVNFDADIDFINDKMQIVSPEINLGEVKSYNVVSKIVDYKSHQLSIDGDLVGNGHQLQTYFAETPLKESIGEALQEIDVKDNINTQLHLTIPFNDKPVQYQGKVSLNNNTLYFKQLNTTLKHVSGEFSFHNSELEGNNLAATWLEQPVSFNFKTKENEHNYSIDSKFTATNWTVRQLTGLPKIDNKSIDGLINWQSNIHVSLPVTSNNQLNYKVSLKGTLSKANFNLPEPLANAISPQFDFDLLATGDHANLHIAGLLNHENKFDSQWLINQNKELALYSASLINDKKQKIISANTKQLKINATKIDGDKWFSLYHDFTAKKDSLLSHSIILPEEIYIKADNLLLLSRNWPQFSLLLHQQSDKHYTLKTKGQGFDFTVQIAPNSPLYIYANYLDYQSGDKSKKNPKNDWIIDNKQVNLLFNQLPNTIFTCQNCRFNDFVLGRVSGALLVSDNQITLDKFLFNNGNTRLALQGKWIKQGEHFSSELNGTATGHDISKSATQFKISIPVKKAAYNIKFNLKWNDLPWKFDVKSLNGKIDGELNNGEIINMGASSANTLLTLVSIDALINRLRLDFRSSFKESFEFNTISATSQIKNGILWVNKFEISGINADILLTGKVNLIAKTLDLQANISPKLSATVGVATALAINPIAGAVAYTASKIFGTLWEKLSFIRYHIVGSYDNPKVSETYRQIKKPETNKKKKTKNKSH